MAHQHEEVLDSVRRSMPEQDKLEALAGLYKVFADSTRMKILSALFVSELCVCAITDLLNMEQSAISHQLKVLKDAKLVGYRRDGKTVCYFLLDDHVRTIIRQGFVHLSEDEK